MLGVRSSLFPAFLTPGLSVSQAPSKAFREQFVFVVALSFPLTTSAQQVVLLQIQTEQVQVLVLVQLTIAIAAALP